MRNYTLMSCCVCFSLQKLHDLGDESKLLPLWRQVRAYSSVNDLPFYRFSKHLRYFCVH